MLNLLVFPISQERLTSSSSPYVNGELIIADQLGGSDDVTQPGVWWSFWDADKYFTTKGNKLTRKYAFCIHIYKKIYITGAASNH